MDDVLNWQINEELSEDFVANINFIYIYNKGKSIICVCNDDNVYSYGDNTDGYLGLGHKHAIDKPTKINELYNKEVITINNTFTSLIAFTKNGQIYSWGLNDCGQCGNGNKDNCLKPVIINALIDKQVIDVKCGANHCLSLTQNGEVFEWGWSFNDEHNYVPIKVNGFEANKIIVIECGAYHSLVITENGTVFSWGWNIYGDGNVKHIISVKINLNEKITKISCGYNHSLLLSENGDIFAFGYNNCGQLGNGTKVNSNLPLKIDISTKFVDILSQNKQEFNISIGLSYDGFCYVWGKCGDQSITEPRKIAIKNIDEALSHYSNIKVTYKPYYIKLMFENLPISSRVEKAFNLQEKSDIAFKIDGKLIYVQSNYLRLVCNHFDVMFAPNVWLENNAKEIEITQYSYSVYYSFIKYLYTNIVDIEIEHIIELYYLADSYIELNLKNKCIKIMKIKTNVNNVYTFYSFAVQNNFKVLENYFYDYMIKYMSDVVNTDTFIQTNEISILKKFVRTTIINGNLS